LQCIALAIIGTMKPPCMLVRCRARDAFELRRCQIRLASADGQRPSQIAAHGGCTAQTVRNTIRAYRADMRIGLRAKSSRPKRVAPVLDEAKRERLRATVPASPRAFGKPTRRWTLRRLAEVGFEQGVTSRALSSESMRGAFKKQNSSGVSAPTSRASMLSILNKRLQKRSREPALGLPCHCSP
jgi:transposase